MSNPIELTGVIKKILEQRSGQGKNGDWKSQEFVLELPGQYPKIVCITCFNDKVDILDNYSEGSTVTVSVNLEAKEYNGKYYNSINAWKIVGETTKRGQSNDNYQMPIDDDGSLAF